MRGSAVRRQLKVCRVLERAHPAALIGGRRKAGLEAGEGWSWKALERSCPAVGEEFPVSLPAPG